MSWSEGGAARQRLAVAQWATRLFASCFRTPLFHVGMRWAHERDEFGRPGGSIASEHRYPREFIRRWAPERDDFGRLGGSIMPLSSRVDMLFLGMFNPERRK